MKKQMISKVLEKMKKHLNSTQMKELEWALIAVLDSYDIEMKGGDVGDNDAAEKIVDRFIMVKHLSGCSEETLKTYNFHIRKFVQGLRKPLIDVNTDDIRSYLSCYKAERNVGNVALNNIRSSLSSLFSWLLSEGLIQKNPMSQVSRIKTDKTIKKPFSDEDMEHLRMQCNRERDIAIMEFLYSTGVRVSEIVRLNRDQIDFSRGECIVFGKGAKEREVYINPKACIHLKKYLDTRIDNDPALFVWTKKPYRRLSKEGIEAVLRKLGRIAGVNHTHPHRFRRTMATNALNRGMPLQEVKELMGHEKMDTTMLYCTISKENIKLSHKKYIA